MQEAKPQIPLLADIDAETLEKNISRIREKLACCRYDEQEPAKLIAVTKTVSPAVIAKLKPLGVLDIAENRAQVLMEKLPLISPEYRLHWIGRLQTNKVKYIIDHISMLHTLDRMELAKEVNRRAEEHGRVISTLVQVNISGETQKGGMPPEDVPSFLKAMKEYPAIRVQGLMSIMPLGADEATLNALFGGMRKLFEQMRDLAIDGVEMKELSMGMSNDFEIAARNGATMVRIGTALYRANGLY